MHLPIEASLAAVRQALAERDEVVLEAPPGAGKTTRVPLALLDEPWLAGQKILLLEPRRIAARAAAYRMAASLREAVGQTVGYRMRLEQKTSPATRIEVITEGILLRLLQADPALDGVGLVIFDEFHERHLDSDVALSLCLQGRAWFRSPEQPLKLLLMSATLDSTSVAAFLNAAPIVRSEGRAYPVEVIYSATPKATERLVERMVAAIGQALLTHPDSSVLVFLPGQGEIQRTAEALGLWLIERRLKDVQVHPLYGNLTLEAQQQAINPLPAGQRKVVLATNIAETSLTIEGVSVVVDSGLVREARFDPNTGMTGLQTSRISRASSVQRAGRAGRLQAGYCYRLWSAGQQEQLAPQTNPEILHADLAPVALQLLQWGIEQPHDLAWLDLPPRGAWQQAVDLLVSLGAIGHKEKGMVLTEHGQRMANLPLHPRLAHLLLKGAAIGQLALAADLASVLAERIPQTDSPDLSQYLDCLAGQRSCAASQQAWLQRTRQLAKQFMAQVMEQDGVKGLPLSPQSSSLSSTQAQGYLLACAYPDRIAQKQPAGFYQLANGRRAALAVTHSLGQHAWLAVAEVSRSEGGNSDTIRLALALDERLFQNVLADQVQRDTVLAWDKKTERFIAEQQRKVGHLLLERKALSNVPREAKRKALLDFVRKQGLALLPWQAQHEQWCARVMLLRQLEPEHGWPDVSHEYLVAHVEQWLAPFLNEINTLADFKQLELSQILTSLLSWELQQRLQQLAPPALTVPSGHVIPLDYSQTPPILAVKLQEMFGCEQTPTVAQGRVAVVVHLLSPAGRPLQVTQDLAGFWRSSYHAIKKEMKGRYPKHPWPDDPLQAIATRKTKNALM